MLYVIYIYIILYSFLLEMCSILEIIPFLYYYVHTIDLVTPTVNRKSMAHFNLKLNTGEISVAMVTTLRISCPLGMEASFQI